MKVVVRQNDPVKALKVLNKKLHNEGIIRTYKDKQSFTSNSERKKAARKAARVRWLKKEAKIKKKLKRLDTFIPRSNRYKKNSNNSGKPVNRVRRYKNDKSTQRKVR